MASLSLPKATLISLGLTCILYGFSLFMFILTLWVHIRGRSVAEMNRPMLAATIAFFVFSTVHTSVFIRHVVIGFLDQDPALFFKLKSSPTFTTKLVLYGLQTMAGDGVLIYRCYGVWQRRRSVIIAPLVLFSGFTGTIFTGIALYNRYILSLAQTMVLVAAGCSFLVNIICTTLLASRLWKLSRSVLPHPAHHSVTAIMWIMVDSAGLYTVTLATTVASVITNINALAIMIEVTIPIISIAFYGVLIRVGMGQVADYNTSDASETVGVLSTVLYLQPVTSKDQHPSDPESSRQHSE